MKTIFAMMILSAATAHGDYNFSASEFFERLSHSIARNKRWPARVTFVPAKISATELRDLLKSSWRIEGTCSGRPIDKAKEDAFVKSHGFAVRRTVFRFLTDWEFELIQYNEDTGKTHSAKVPYFAQIIDGEQGLLTMKSPRYIESTFQAHTISETGEMVMIDKSRQLAEHFTGLCEKDETYLYVFVKEPTS